MVRKGNQVTQSKEEKEFQKDCIAEWKEWGFFCSKTHEMLSSGKPDLRTGHVVYGQLDIELKYKTTGDRGKDTGLTSIQEIKIGDMNEAGMPAIVLVYDAPNHRCFVTLSRTEDVRELGIDAVLTCVVKKAPSPIDVYRAAKRLLEKEGYPSAKFIQIDR